MIDRRGYKNIYHKANQPITRALAALNVAGWSIALSLNDDNKTSGYFDAWLYAGISLAQCEQARMPISVRAHLYKGELFEALDLPNVDNLRYEIETHLLNIIHQDGGVAELGSYSRVLGAAKDFRAQAKVGLKLADYYYSRNDDYYVKHWVDKANEAAKEIGITGNHLLVAGDGFRTSATRFKIAVDEYKIWQHIGEGL